ncbi:MAG: polysaccharide biosynthesis/export family protein [Bacteroidaceae bacterium]|nr:polysaccharide biosynthesis/export family protein [Bacteroidaceae bacterium]
MKKFLLLLTTAIVTFTSCNTKEKVVYFQDIQNAEVIQAQMVENLKFQPGDRLTIVVTSSLTPEDAVSYNLPIVTMQAGSVTGQNYSNQMSYYTVEPDGMIEVAGLGRMVIAGKSRSEVTEELQNKLRNGLLNDAIVAVNPVNQYINILGEVKTPNRYLLNKDNITILEAITMAGDLTIQGDRSNILVMRNENGQVKNYYMDIRSKDIFSSPAFYLKQNDIVYVQPNEVKSNNYVNNGNSIRQISTWLSLLSFITTTIILIKNW